MLYILNGYVNLYAQLTSIPLRLRIFKSVAEQCAVLRHATDGESNASVHHSPVDRLTSVPIAWLATIRSRGQDTTVLDLNYMTHIHHRVTISIQTITRSIYSTHAHISLSLSLCLIDIRACDIDL